MAFRVVLIENEMELKLNLDNLVCRKEDGDIRIPLEDISVIILDNLKLSVTTRLMNKLADNNIAMVVCNYEHLPIGFFSAYDNHSRMAKKIRFQIGTDEEFYDGFWMQIVKAKLYNQAGVLGMLGKEQRTIDSILQFRDMCLPRDPSNREAHAAKIYFNTLMGTTFSRGNEDLVINSGLDYGYAIVRAYMARLSVAYGLNTQLGIHHRSEYNRFNLVDDLIEPIRPMVDLHVYHLMNNVEYFTAEHRHSLVGFLNHLIVYKGKKIHISSMLEEYVSDYAALLEGKDREVVFPIIEKYLGEENGAL